jgi:predicted DNA-binding transcriptional regulator YafY
MPTNRNALIRYKTIDQCLRNRFRRWTLSDLIDACSDALYEYEGIMDGISRRTVQSDIQVMRSEKLGYNAPIVVVDRKYYTYDDPEYSIMNLPISQQGLGQLQQAVQVLKQFQGFTHFQELSGLVQKLEGHVYAEQSQRSPVVDFERNDNLKGLSFLDTLYKAITKQQALKLSYQSFRARQANSFIFHACLLKEFNNRWFVLGCRNDQSLVTTLALDRIQEANIEKNISYRIIEGFDARSHYKDVIGVTVDKTRPTNIKIWVSPQHAPYVLTKPLHHSQQLLERNSEGAIIQIKVQLNLELEARILSFGDGMKVMSPERLRKKLVNRLKWAVEQYEKDVE